MSKSIGCAPKWLTMQFISGAVNWLETRLEWHTTRIWIIESVNLQSIAKVRGGDPTVLAKLYCFFSCILHFPSFLGSLFSSIKWVPPLPAFFLLPLAHYFQPSVAVAIGSRQTIKSRHELSMNPSPLPLTPWVRATFGCRPEPQSATKESQKRKNCLQIKENFLICLLV